MADDNFAIINQGDTATLWSVIFQDIEPISYIWTPNYNISDTSIACPKAWPDTNTDYQVIKIESIGCVSEPDLFWVHVIPTGINTENNNQKISIVYPNPININSSIIIKDTNQDKLNINIINSAGQLIIIDEFIDNENTPGIKVQNHGHIDMSFVYSKFVNGNAGNIVKKGF